MQFEVKDSVKQNIETMLLDKDGGRAMHPLLQIRNALETPYSGPEIPQL
jgi:hypothetical protein